MRWVATILRRAEARSLPHPEVMPRWRRWSVRLVLAITLATALAYFPYHLLDGMGARKVAELESQHARTVETCRELDKENERLRSEVSALKNDVSAVEDIARRELGLVRPGEVIFRIAREPETLPEPVVEVVQ